MEKEQVVAELRKRNRFVLAEKVAVADKASMTPEEKEILKKFYGFKESDFEVATPGPDTGLKSQEKF